MLREPAIAANLVVYVKLGARNLWLPIWGAKKEKGPKGEARHDCSMFSACPGLVNGESRLQQIDVPLVQSVASVRLIGTVRACRGALDTPDQAFLPSVPPLPKGRGDRGEVYGTSNTFPVVFLPSSARCASAALASGNSAPIRTFTFPA